MMRQYMVEFVGTAVLVLLGCGSAVIAGSQIGILGIALAFGLVLIALAYSIGPISGCHINPAVSLGFFAAGRLKARDLAGYVIAQLLGGVLGAFLLLMIVKGQVTGYNLAIQGLGQNGWGAGYFGQYNLQAAMLFEFIATLLFVRVILASTKESAPSFMAGLVIGLTLTLVNIVGINITGTSVNPARSLGPALLVGGTALSQVWMFLLVPSVAGFVGGWLSRMVITERWARSHPENLNVQPQ